MTRISAGLHGLVFMVGVAMSACGGAQGAADEIVVSAAASLTDAFGGIEAEFEQRNPDLNVVLNLGGSSTLREQIVAGVPADVYAAADESNVAAVVKSGTASGDPVGFATNRMQIAVPPGNPGDVTGLTDFSKDDLLLGLCAAGVPCGDLARMVLTQAGVQPSIDTNEPSVRALLTKIEVGELDAGIVYETDVAAAAVEGITIPSPINVTTSYPIVALAGGEHPDAGRTFVEFVLSEVGQEILADFGFGP